MNTHFFADLNITYPLIQAPMAGAQDERLAIAVARAGGLGSIPAAMLTPEQLSEQLSRFKASNDAYAHAPTTLPVNVNFFAHRATEADTEQTERWLTVLTPYYDEFGINPQEIQSGASRAPFSAAMADVVEHFKPQVVSFHFGLPETTLLQRVKATGARIISSATTVREAVWLEQQGVDAIIAQGLEAGGHRGHFLSDDLSEQMGIFALLPQIVTAVRSPVIAAGGIATIDGIRAAMRLGAAGVQIGTAYLLCDEANTSPLHRVALQSETAQHTALTNLFSGRPARGIVNRVMRELGSIRNDVPSFPHASTWIAPLRTVAEKQGLTDFTPLWAGQNTQGCQSMGAFDLTQQLIQAFN